MTCTEHQSNHADDAEGFVVQLVISLAVLAVFAAPVVLAAIGA